MKASSFLLPIHLAGSWFLKAPGRNFLECRKETATGFECGGLCLLTTQRKIFSPIQAYGGVRRFQATSFRDKILSKFRCLRDHVHGSVQVAKLDEQESKSVCRISFGGFKLLIAEI